MSAASIFARSPLLWLLLPFASGIAVAQNLNLGTPLALALAALAVALVSYFVSRTDNTNSWKVAIVICLLLAGMARHSVWQPNESPRNSLPQREIKVELKIDRLYQQENRRLTGLGKIIAANEHIEDLTGERVYFSLDSDFIPMSVAKGSRIQAIGIFNQLAARTEESGFNNYLRKCGISTILHRGSVLEIVDHPKGINWLTFVSSNWIQNLLEAGLSLEASYTKLYKAMMLGLKSELVPEQKDVFLRNGAMHLFAVSGLHVGVIAACIHSLLLIIRIPKNWIPVPSLVLIGLFCIATGGATSTWRAMTMIACFYLCQSLKRQPAALNALALSAMICLLASPNQLFMAGFQMSYATVAAILLYGVPLANRVQNNWKPYSNLPRQFWGPGREAVVSLSRGLINLTCIGFAAFIASAALGMFYFKLYPVFGVISNIAVLPLASLAIVAGFCSISVSLVGLAFLSELFNHSAALLLLFIERLLQNIASIEYSHVILASYRPSLIMAFFAVIMTALLAGYDQKWKWRLRWLWAFPVAASLAAFLIASIA